MPTPRPPADPSTELPPPTDRFPARAAGAFRHRNFRLYVGGHLVSLIGWSMHTVAQPWLVLDLTNSPFFVGFVSMLGALPITLFALWGGLIADRFPKRRVLMITQSVAMIAALTLAAVVLADVVTLTHVMIIASVLGTAAAFDIPGRQAFMVELVGKADLMNAIALNSASFNGSRIVGPAVAGVLIGVVGVGVCFLINGLSYLALLAGLAAMRFGARPAPARPVTARSTVREGLAYVSRDRRLRTLVLMIAAGSVFGFPFHILLPVLARDVLGLGSAAFGWMVSAAGLGAMVGALGLAVAGHRVSKGLLVGTAAPLFGLFVALLGIATSLPVLLPLLALAGFAQVVHTATTNTLLQTLARDDLRGRVISMYTMAFLGLLPLGSVLAGTVAEAFSPGTWLVGAGLVCSTLMLIALRAVPEIRAIR